MPGVVKNGDTRFEFVMVEVKQGCVRAEVINTLRQHMEIIRVCDNKLLDSHNNNVRRLFNWGAKFAENLISEFLGANTVSQGDDIANKVANSITEQFPLFNTVNSTQVYMTYSVETIKIVSVIDQQTCLMLLLLSQIAWRQNLFASCEWKAIGCYSSQPIQWPEMYRSRK